MSDNVEVSPGKLRQAGSAHATVHDRLQRIVTEAQAAMAVGSAAWGSDKFGSDFAHGSGGQGFVPGMDTLIGNTAAMAHSFDEVAGGQRTAATQLEQTEQVNTGSFGRRR